VNAFFEEFFRVGVYKRNQGRIVRQVTFAALAVGLLIGVLRLSVTLKPTGAGAPQLWDFLTRLPHWMVSVLEFLAAYFCYWFPGLLAVVGLWAAYRVVNLPVFADFLIAVEAEMNKVSWPSRGELFRWSVVVIVVIFAIGILLAGFDAVWTQIFKFIGVYGGHST
jgi:preprotein translocase subunit SecE